MKIVLNLLCILFVGYVYFECNPSGRLYQDLFVNAGRGNVWGVLIWAPIAILFYGLIILYVKRSGKHRKNNGNFSKKEASPVVSKNKDLCVKKQKKI